MVQYKAALGITSGMKGTAHFGIESLADRRWSKSFFFYSKLYKDLYHLTFESIVMLLVKKRN